MGPLKNIKIIEMAGIGPAPLCGMLLADMGAQIITIHRVSQADPDNVEIHERGKKSIALNLKTEQGLDIAKKLINSSDALIEGFRPGVMERLGLGPDECLSENPKLVYGRMTGWGQTGPLSQAAGHDINYIALTGALHCIGNKGEKPTVPLNLVGDNGGGALFLAFGLMCGIIEAQQSGIGQVVDTAMTEGASSLMTLFYSLYNKGAWVDERGSNFLDGAAPFYNTYETKDSKYISLGPLEPQFYQEFVELAELDKDVFSAQYNETSWPKMTKALTEVFLKKTRDEWCDILEGTDACFAPILSLSEAPHHPHNKSRESFVEINGKWQPAPAPRFSVTQAQTPTAPVAIGSSTVDVLMDLGYSEHECNEFKNNGILT
jgi:alpha-methylacyl-CoA racemase